MSKKPQLSLLAVGVSVATLLLASTSSFANGAYKGENYKGEAMPAPCPVETMLKDGFYVGAQVGYDMYRISHDFTVEGDDVELDGDPTLSVDGWVGGLFLGFGKYWDNFYLGAEIFGNASGAKSDWDTSVEDDDEGVDVDIDVKVKSQYGISLLPGYKINNNSLLYLRVGYNWAKVDFDADASDDDGDDLFGSDDNETVHGWGYGVGIETLLMDNLSVRAEYTYTKYNDPDNDDEDDGHVDFDHLSDNQFMMSLIYHIS